MNSEISSFSGEYSFLSNFHTSIVVYQDRCYTTAEHAFQSAKNNTAEYVISIFNTPTPDGAKKLGRKIELRKDWEDVKDNIMEEILRSKFNDRYLNNSLKETNNSILIEGNTWGDTYWGVCNGVGENKLGLLLMKIRDELS